MAVSFHAQHSPNGAFASFTLGMAGEKGGMAIAKGGPGNGNIFAGIIDQKTFTVLPFFKNQDLSAAANFGLKSDTTSDNQVDIIPESEIVRDYAWATDSLQARNLKLDIITPFFKLTDPDQASSDQLKRESMPAIYLRLSFDNSQGKRPVTGVFAMGGYENKIPLESIDGLSGFSFQDGTMGLGTREKAKWFAIYDLMHIFDHKLWNHYLSGIFGLTFDIAAGEKKEVLFALSFYQAGVVTRRFEMKYFYTRYFSSAEDVLDYALDQQEYFLDQAAARDSELKNSKLNPERQFLIAHATRSFYGSTQWLDYGGRPFWNVNEGEYRMINTFDLAVDMVFYQLEWMPWTVKNELVYFMRLYSYYDQVYDPTDPSKLYPGGISFAHDQGYNNTFSPEGHSSYELAGLDRKCFSYMTCEQLVNFILTFAVYVKKTADQDFLTENLKVIKDCYQSLLNRDHYDVNKRNGIMKLESSRCQGGGEITTYDSLDHSLGQARNNLYLAVKCWAAYVAMSDLFGQSGELNLQTQAKASAHLGAATIVSHYDAKLGYIPAVFEQGNQSAIIPAIEGLVFPYYMGLTQLVSEQGEFGQLVSTLKKHYQNILKKGVCLYDDGAWKLSSTADNSWASKIFLCQFVAERIFGIDPGKQGQESDNAHVNWQVQGSTFTACSDQFASGKVIGSRYYPRVVTNYLWLK